MWFLQKAQLSIDVVVNENSELMARVREVRQELIKERSQVCQLTSDKMDSLQRLHVSLCICISVCVSTCVCESVCVCVAVSVCLCVAVSGCEYVCGCESVCGCVWW